MPVSFKVEYPYYYEPYIRKLPFDHLGELIDQLHEELSSFYLSIPEQLGNHRYAMDKWSVKEVFQHLIDTERVFSYRALCIARREPAALPSMNEHQYVLESNVMNRSLLSLQDEWITVRESTNSLFRNFDNAQLKRKGLMAGQPASVKGIGAIIFAHQLHHKRILEERYMK